MAQPVYGTKKTSVNTQNVELAICLDISNSMNTKDISRNESRLDISKRALIALLNQLQGEKVSVIVFAQESFIQLPRTIDYSSAKLFIEEIQSNMLSAQGTNVSYALETALSSFSKEDLPKSILLITDGENHESLNEEVLEKIKEQKIVTGIIGIGTKQGGPVPIDPLRPEMGYKRNDKGYNLVSKMNPSLISYLASKTNAYSILTDSPFPDLSPVLTKINQTKHSKGLKWEIVVQDNWFQIPLFASGIFWLLFLFGWNTKKIKKMVFRKANLLILFLCLNVSFFTSNAQSWRDSLLLARKAYKNKDYKKAHHFYQSASKNIPKNLSLKDELGQNAYQLRDFKKASYFFEQQGNLHQNKSKKASSYHNLGNAYMQQKKYDDAINAFKKALKNNPKDQQTRYNLSQALRRKNHQLKNQNQQNNSKEKKKQQNNKDHNNQSKDNDSKNQNKDQSSKGNLPNKSVDKLLDQLTKAESATKRKINGNKRPYSQANSGKDW